MEKKKFIVIVSLLSFAIWLSLWFLMHKPDTTINYNSNSEHIHSSPPFQPTFQEQEEQRTSTKFHHENTLNYTEIFSSFLKDENLWMPEDWTGLPISKGNSLYVDYKKSQESLDKFYEFLNVLEGFDTFGWSLGDDVWINLINQYKLLIGWNGIFDAVEKAEENYGSEFAKRLHSLGEFLAKEDVRGKYMIEITSREMLHKAPMHGAVWSIINEVGTDDVDEFFQVVNDELCFFKNYPTMGNIWISCAHGVGHGLAQLFGKEGIPEALDMCDAHDDAQFKYACATGIYMALGSEFPTGTFQPCDTNKFAPACFRFKTKMSMLLFANVTDPCVTQRTPYHRRACIWGFAYVSSNRNPLSGLDICDVYRPKDPLQQPAANDYAACLDGFWGSHELRMVPADLLPESYCEVLKRYETAYNVCLYYKSNTLKLFSFGDNDESFFYNFELLEELFTPSLLHGIQPARLLPEWKNTRVDLTAQLQQMLGGPAPTQQGGHQH